MTKKDIPRLFVSLIGTALLALCVVWAYHYVSFAVSIALISCVPITLALFACGIFLKKPALYKLATLIAYFGVIIISIACLVLSSGILTELLEVESAMDLSNLLKERYGNWVGVAIIVVEFLQVTFVPIPSSIVTGAAYYICGQNPWLAILYSCIGLWLGSFLAFFLGRTFGIKLVKWVAGEKVLLKYNNLVKGKDKIMLIYMFILPVFPDDILCMIAGLTTMTYTGFIIIQLISRPLNVAATVFLLHFSTGLTELIPFTEIWGIVVWIIIAVAFVALFILVWKMADKLEAAMYKLITKITGRTILIDINQLYGINQPASNPTTALLSEISATEENTSIESTIDETVKETPEERELRLEREQKEKSDEAFDIACKILEKEDADIRF